MIVLSADTSAKTVSVCVCSFRNGELLPLARAAASSTLTRSGNLLPMIDFCLRGADLTWENVDAAVVSVGPGSFTGVRVGVSAFKGLGFARQDMPFIGVSTLEALAYNLVSYPAGSILFPVMDARRAQFYNAAFASTGKGTVKRLCDDRLESFDTLYHELKTRYPAKRIRLVGDGAELFYEKYRALGDTSPVVSLCDPRDRDEDAYGVARCAVRQLAEIDKNKSNAFPSALLEPVYLRASQAERERKDKNDQSSNTEK